MSRRLRYALFALVCAVQIAVPASLIVKHEQTRAEGMLWKFQTAPVDPNDPFRGRYVRLSFAAEREHVPFADQGMIYVRPQTRMYAELAAGADGFARLAQLHDKRPASGEYLDVFVRDVHYSRGEKADRAPPEVFVRLPFDRYYLPEDRAPEVERQYFEATRGAQANTYAEVRVREGHAALTALVLDGKPVD